MKQNQNDRGTKYLSLKRFCLVCICVGLFASAFVYLKDASLNGDGEHVVANRLSDKSKALASVAMSPRDSRPNASKKLQPDTVNRAPARRNEKAQDASMLPTKPPSKQQLSFRELKALHAQKYREASKDEQYDFKNESGDAYTLSADLAAVRKGPFNEDVYPGAPVVNGYYIVDRLAVAGEGEVKSVVQNQNTNRAAVFTGQVKVKLKDFGYERDFENIYGCEIAHRYEHISSLLCRFDTYEEALAALNQMRGDQGVVRANLEILEYERQGR